MINIGFVNLIMIIADNASGSGELSNPYPFTSGVLGSPRLFGFVISGSPHPSLPVKSSDLSNCMPDFLADVRTWQFLCRHFL